MTPVPDPAERELTVTIRVPTSAPCPRSTPRHLNDVGGSAGSWDDGDADDPEGGATMNDLARVPESAVGYVFRTEPANKAWAYIGQSTRLDAAHIDGYFGSGAFMTEVIAKSGTSGLTKTIVATAESPLELHYLEMLHLAEARRDGVRVGNGDFGGPRPFPNLQQALWEVAPAVIRVAGDPKRFYDALVKHRDQVEQAILDSSSIPVDAFYAGMERDLRATEDLSRPCPSCGSDISEVCRTNSKSLTKPRNPTSNHAKRSRS